jgi:hypothetical protein
MNARNTAFSGKFRPTFISLVNVPWRLENKWCLINRWLGLHVTSFLPCMPAIIKPWHHAFRERPWIHDNGHTTVRWMEDCSARWVPDPSCTEAWGQFKPWGMVAWALPNPEELGSTMFCCCPCFHFPQATLNWESCHTKQVHLPPASSIDWLGCHSNRPGRSYLWTLPIPGDVGPLWHHKWVFSDWSYCVSTRAKAPHPAYQPLWCQ